MRDADVKLSGGEYWILSVSVDCWFPCGLLASPHLDEIVNRKSHGLDGEELFVAFHGLLVRDFLGVKLSHQSPREDVAPRAVRDPEEVRRLLAEAPDLPPEDRSYFGLTERGGAAWESFTRPEWSRFVREENYGSGTAHCTCADERFLRRFCSVYAAAHCGSVEDGSLEIERVSDWSATYWKALPSGFRARLSLPKFGAMAPRTGITSQRFEQERAALVSLGLLRTAWCRTGP